MILRHHLWTVLVLIAFSIYAPLSGIAIVQPDAKGTPLPFVFGVVNGVIPFLIAWLATQETKRAVEKAEKIGDTFNFMRLRVAEVRLAFYDELFKDVEDTALAPKKLRCYMARRIRNQRHELAALNRHIRYMAQAHADNLEARVRAVASMSNDRLVALVAATRGMKIEDGYLWQRGEIVGSYEHDPELWQFVTDKDGLYAIDFMPIPKEDEADV